MKIKTFVIIGTAAICLSLFSCQTMAQIADVSAQIAGSAGVIDKNVANAISQSSKAIGSAAEVITPEQEYFIGRAVGANVLSTYKIWDESPALTAYLNRICNGIVVNSPRPDIFNGYHVAILDSAEINAFATSGGHIFVTRGLIAAAKSEDALAGVIAHEIAHIQLQHSIKAIRTSRITNAVLITGTSAAGAATGLNVNELTDVFNESVGEIVNTMVNSGYSQQQEFEADNYALSLLASTKYSPSGLLDMLKELRTAQSTQSGGFNKTHPTPAQRISNAEKSIGKYTVADTQSARQKRFNEAK
jgi:predicted Zn-dependent protease